MILCPKCVSASNYYIIIKCKQKETKSYYLKIITFITASSSNCMRHNKIQNKHGGVFF